MSVLLRSLNSAFNKQPTKYQLLLLSRRKMASQTNSGPATPLIGIDMGTAFCRVAVLHKDKIEVLPNSRGNISTPAVVAFTDSECLVGEEAKEQLGLNPLNTVYDTKRLIGRSFNQIAQHEYKRHWPFTLTSAGQHARVHVHFKGQTRDLYPEQIYSMLLSKMKDTAEAHLGTRVTDAVVTVPASFNHLQRESVRLAGKLANLNIVRVINESTSAGVAHVLQQKLNAKLGDGVVPSGNIMVVHFGGGHVSVTIMGAEDGIVEVKATAGDDNVGGVDFDNRIEDFLMAEVKTRMGTDMSLDERVVARVRFIAEEVKKRLTKETNIRVCIDALVDGIDFTTDITRATFEELTSDLFYRTLVPIERCLHNANMSRDQIQELVLVGGSSKMPRFQTLLHDFFGGVKLSTVGPAGDSCQETAIVTGAAAQAAILSGQNYPLTQDILLLDVTPFSLGVQLPNGDMGVMLAKNSVIPTRASAVFRTPEGEEGSTRFAVKIYEGERKQAKENTFLGTAELTDLSPDIRDSLILVCFTVDSNDNVTVDIAQRGTENHSVLELTKGHCDFTPSEIDQMIAEAEYYRTEEDIQQRRISAWRSLEICAFNAKASLASKMKELQIAAAQVEDVIGWLKENRSPAEIDCRRREELIKSTCALVLPAPVNARKMIIERFNPSWLATDDAVMKEA